MGQPWIGVAAEVTLQDLAVFGAIEDGAPGLEFADALRGFLGMDLRHAPLIEILAAFDRVAKVDFPLVAVVHVR